MKILFYLSKSSLTYSFSQSLTKLFNRQIILLKYLTRAIINYIDLLQCIGYYYIKGIIMKII